MADKFETGDIFLLKGTSFISKVVRFLVSIRYGIPYKHAMSHIESAIDSKTTISAESSGTKKMKIYEKMKDADVYAYRLRDMDEERKENHKFLASKYEGRGYAYARYALDAIRIFLFFLIPFTLFFAFFDSLWAICGIVLLLAFFSYGKKKLKDLDKLTSDCAELQSLIYTENGFYVPMSRDRHRDEHPNGMKQWLDLMCLYKQADMVAIKMAGDDKFTFMK